MSPWAILTKRNGHVALGRWRTQQQAEDALDKTLSELSGFYREDYDVIDIGKLKP